MGKSYLVGGDLIANSHEIILVSLACNNPRGIALIKIPDIP